jgi:DNA (cytosine-5)-methyltransferase 1
MIKVGSDFSGVGAFNQALIRLGIEYKELFACDMDKYARQTFIHNYGEPEYYPTNVYDRAIPNESLDIYMTSPPCQAFSLAGKRLGKEDKRGILFFNSHEFIQKNKPRYFIFENVKGLLSDNGGKTFSEWVNLLGGKSINGNPVIFPYEDALPYHLYYKVLNAKHHGVPQNRERVFLIGIRDDEDNNFRFPVEEQLTKRLKDVLEDNVNEKYFLSVERIETITNSERGIGFTDTENKITSNCLLTGYAKNPTDAEYIKVKYQKEIEQSINQDICTGIDASYYKGFGVRQGKCRQVVKVKSATSKGYEEATEDDSINLSVPNSETRRGRVGKGVAQTLDTGCNQGVIHNCITQAIGRQGSSQEYLDSCKKVYETTNKIRRLTPRECFRLMDFPDTFTWPVSDSQAYKQAGNSIVVNVLYKIIKNLKL